MRKLLVLGALAATAVLSTTFAVAGGGAAAPKPGLAAAVAKTQAASSERYSIDVRLTRAGTPISLHIKGQMSARTVSVAMQMSDLRLDDGTVVPGPNGAALLNGSYLYERAPSNIAVDGDIQWLRLRVEKLAPTAEDLVAVRAMTPSPLLRLLRTAHVRPASQGGHVFHGWVAYDEPAMRRLSQLTSELEFRNLRISAVVGRDGRVHRMVLTGRTADAATRLSLRVRIFAFGKPVHVMPPKPGAFMDEELAQMPA